MGKSKVAWEEGNLIRTSGQNFPKLSKTLAWGISFPRQLWIRKDEECSDCLPVSHPTSVRSVPEEKNACGLNVRIESKPEEDIQANRAAI